MMKPNNFSGYGCLFIGDLPKYCQEEHIEHLFAAFGPVLDVKIKKSVNETRTITYAFVTMATVEVAEIAKSRLDGQMFMGRILRVNWAFQHSKGGDKNGAINSIYVRYSTPITDRTITNQDLLQVFIPFGYIEDVSIKESFIDHRGGSQYGYGFVHFASSQEGVQAAFKAVKCIHKTTMNHITFTAELSRNLLKQFEQANRLAAAAAANGPVSVSPSNSMMYGGNEGYNSSSSVSRSNSGSITLNSGSYPMSGQYVMGNLSCDVSLDSHSASVHGDYYPSAYSRGNAGIPQIFNSMPPSPLNAAVGAADHYNGGYFHDGFVNSEMHGRPPTTPRSAMPPLPPRHLPPPVDVGMPNFPGGSHSKQPSPRDFIHRGMVQSASSPTNNPRHFTFEGISRVDSESSVVSTGLAMTTTSTMTSPRMSYEADRLTSRMASMSLDSLSGLDSPIGVTPSSATRRKSGVDNSNSGGNSGGIALQDSWHSPEFPVSFPPAPVLRSPFAFGARPGQPQTLAPSPTSRMSQQQVPNRGPMLSVGGNESDFGASSMSLPLTMVMGKGMQYTSMNVSTYDTDNRGNISSISHFSFSHPLDGSTADNSVLVDHGENNYQDNNINHLERSISAPSDPAVVAIDNTYSEYSVDLLRAPLLELPPLPSSSSNASASVDVDGLQNDPVESTYAPEGTQSQS
eukprot:gene6691-7398_t